MYCLVFRFGSHRDTNRKKDIKTKTERDRQTDIQKDVLFCFFRFGSHRDTNRKKDIKLRQRETERETDRQTKRCIVFVFLGLAPINTQTERKT